MDGRTWMRVIMCLGAAALLAVSGCAKQEEASAPPDVAAESEDYAKQDLSQSEEQVFSKKSKLDTKLSPAMEEAVRLHFAHYLHERRDTMEKFLRNSLPYINHTRGVFRSQGLPEELACLAYLESGYNPLAVSRSNAVGMWQFISSTGRNFGLRQDWWEDQRMDPYRSTDAAAEYLGRLYDIFKDWHLAIASYNGGEGKISRAKAATKASSLHEILSKNDTLDANLQLREETVLYVPRFLAIAKIMNDPEALGLAPAAPEPGKPVLLPSAALTAKPATDLVELARRLNMPWSEFLAYNPHFLRSISPAGRSSTVYIPKTKEAEAKKLLEGTLSGAGWKYYTVKKKQGLAAVASATGVPAGVVKQLNPGVMKPGRKLRLPAQRGSVPDKPIIIPRESYLAAEESSVTAALAELSLPVSKKGSRVAPGLKTTKRGEYTVKSGDTLFALALACGLSVDELVALNGGSKAMKTLKAGQKIKIPAKASRLATAPAREGRAGKPGTHKVQAGESGYGIAAHYGISFSALAAANGGKEAMEKLRVGQTLVIPGESATQGATAGKNATGSQRSSKGAAPATPSAPAQDPKAGKPRIHKVKAGESGYGIAARYGISFSALAAANGGKEAMEKLRVGQTLAIPGESSAQAAAQSSPKGTAKASSSKPATSTTSSALSSGKVMSYRVESGETLWGIARKFNMSPTDLLNLNGMAPSTRVKAGQTVNVIPGN